MSANQLTSDQAQTPNLIQSIQHLQHSTILTENVYHIMLSLGEPSDSNSEPTELTIYYSKSTGYWDMEMNDNEVCVNKTLNEDQIIYMIRMLQDTLRMSRQTKLVKDEQHASD